MAEITRLLDLTARVVPPRLDELARVASARRRRAVVLAASATCLAVVGVAVATGVAGSREGAPEPARPVGSPSSGPSTSPSTSPSAPPSTSPSPRDTPTPSGGSTSNGGFPVLTPKQIRQHPDATAADAGPATGSPGVAARIWSVCLDDCSRGTEPVIGELQEALEVTDDDYATSALHSLRQAGPNISHAVDDWYLVDGLDRTDLVDSRGHRRPVTRGGSVPVEEIAGPLVYSLGGLAYLDLETDRMFTLEGTGDWDWWGARDTWLWGSVYLVEGSTGQVIRHAVAWRNPDGSFSAKALPIGPTRVSTLTLRSGVPGTMGVADPGPPHLLHVTTDYGTTWQVRRIPSGVQPRSSLPDGWSTWPPA